MPDSLQFAVSHHARERTDRRGLVVRQAESEIDAVAVPDAGDRQILAKECAVFQRCTEHAANGALLVVRDDERRAVLIAPHTRPVHGAPLWSGED